MATVRWTPNNASKKQTVTLTVGSTTVGHTFQTTINSKTYTYVAVSGDTLVTISAAIASLLASAVDGEFQKIGWTTDGVSVVTGTANTAGEPFTVSVGGTGTYTLATVQANSSPNDLNVGANWSTGALPAGTDDVVFELTDQGGFWNLESALSALTFTSLKVRDSFTSRLANPDYNADGKEFLEYRGIALTITGATTLEVWQSSSASTGDFRFNVGAVQQTLRVYGGGGGSIGSEVVFWKGSHASNAVYVVGGSLAIAAKAGETATAATIYVENGQVRCGPGVTHGTITLNNSTLDTRSSITTLTQIGSSSATVRDTATVGTANVDGGTLFHNSSGTVTAILAAPGSVLDFSGGRDAVTVTNCTINSGCTINDPNRRVVWTNPIVLNRCSPTAVVLNIGTHVKIAPSAGP